MGRGRKGLIEQSVKKPKKTSDEDGGYWHKLPKKPPVLSKEFIEELKRMGPKEFALILCK